MSLINLTHTPNCDRSSIRLFPLTKVTREKKVVVDDPQLFCDKGTIRPYTLFTLEELYLVEAGDPWVVDVECYLNYFIVSFLHIPSDKVFIFEQDEDSLVFDRKLLYWMMCQFLTIGFNSIYYDLVMIDLAIRGLNCSELRRANDYLIKGKEVDGEYVKLQSWEVRNMYKLPENRYNHIDLINVAPLQASLKIYGARLHCTRMQDIPFDPEKHLLISVEEQDVLRRYNINDLDLTKLMWNKLQPQIKLRYQMSEQYNVDVRSKSDAQVAESVLQKELGSILGGRIYPPQIKIGHPFKYRPPKWMSFQSPRLRSVLDDVQNQIFKVGKSGSIDLPEGLKEAIEFEGAKYKFGIGGLHSSETCIAHKADEQYMLIDRDVASYYPAIMLNTELYPHHIGRPFIDVYRTIVQRRLKAKRENDKTTADSLKICINGTFGKLGSKYSAMYAPDRLMQVTITGQLSLLMLIEKIHSVGGQIISANTDGVLIKCLRSLESTIDQAISEWEKVTGFETEPHYYSATYSRDVNGYIAIGIDGKVAKLKGPYAEPGLQKNPEYQVCVEAVVNFLTKNIPIVQTISETRDIRKFLSLRKVDGGAIKSGVALGKCVRWYFSTMCEGQIEYEKRIKQDKNHFKVSDTDGAMPYMEIEDEFPTDIDIDRYVKKAEEILVEIGASKAGSKVSFI